MTWALIFSAIIAISCAAWFVAWDWGKPGQERKHPLLLVLAVLLLLPPDPADARVDLEPIVLPDIAALVAAVLIEVGLDVGAPVSDPEAPTVAPPEVAPAPPAGATPTKPAASPKSKEAIIREVFGPHGSAAVAVARCESGLRTTARNGQYRGIFQMGANERATYGHGFTAREQAEAAKRYFDRAGWRPWKACR